MTVVDDILEHHGIKGMKWGVRRRNPSGPAPTPIDVKAVPGKSVVTSGGKNIPTHGDAINAAKLRQRNQSSGKQSLSNQEIKKLIDRLNLEQQLEKLDPKKKTFGQKFMDEVLYGATPAIALKSAQVILKDKKDPKIAKGLATAEMIINARPAPPKKK